MPHAQLLSAQFSDEELNTQLERLPLEKRQLLPPEIALMWELFDRHENSLEGRLERAAVLRGDYIDPQQELFQKRDKLRSALISCDYWKDSDHASELEEISELPVKKGDSPRRLVVDGENIFEDGPEDDDFQEDWPDKIDMRSTIKQESDCQKWLIDLMFGNSVPEKSKNAYMNEAKSKFDNIAHRSFDRAWANAIVETENQNWSRPGRKS